VLRHYVGFTARFQQVREALTLRDFSGVAAPDPDIDDHEGAPPLPNTRAKSTFKTRLSSPHSDLDEIFADDLFS
jgi:hypothetical protein